MTAMHHNTRLGRTEQLEALISQGGDLHDPDIDGRTPAHLAARWKRPGALKVLLGALNADDQATLVNTVDKEGNSVLYLAAFSGCLESVELALKAGGSLFLMNRDEKSPLMVAAGNGNKKVVKCLLQKLELEDIVKHLEYINKKDKKGMTAMHHAARNGHADVIDLLIDWGGDRQSFDKQGRMPLLWATLGCHHNAARALLKGLNAGEQTELVNLRGVERHQTVLFSTMEAECLECFNIVRQAGGKVDEGCQTPLIGAAYFGNLEVVVALLDNFNEEVEGITKVEYINMLDDYDKTAMFYAARNDHASVIEVLIRHGGNRQKGNGYRTPLHKAVSNQNPSAVRALLRGLNRIEKAAFMNLRNAQGESVMFLAACGECWECIDIVYRAGGIFSQAASDGKTALMRVATYFEFAFPHQMLDIFNEGREDMSVVEFMNMADEHGKTAMHRAAEGGHSNFVRELVNRGADTGCRELIRSQKNELPGIFGSSRYGHSVMYYAATNGSEECIGVLYEAGAKLSDIGSDGMTPLMSGINSHNLKVVNHLLSIFNEETEGMTKAEYINMKDVNGLTAMHWAVMSGHVDAIKVLIDDGGDIEISDIKGRTPLHLAARENHLALTVFLKSLTAYEQAALVNKCDAAGRSLLYSAILGRCYDCEFIMRDAGVQLPGAKQVDYESEVLKCIDVVYQAGGKLNLWDHAGVTLLMIAAKEKGSNVVDHLLEIFNEGTEGLSRLEYINKKDQTGKTAMHWAADSYGCDVVKKLIEWGGDEQCRDNRGDTPSDLAAKFLDRWQESEKLKRERIRKLLQRLDVSKNQN